jgi:hypothetical protein
MNKDPKEFKCECCDYITIVKANLLRHMERKHKNEVNNEAEVATPIIQNEEVASLKSEILALKAEIETLKHKHQLELLQQKCDLLQQIPQNTIVSRRSIIPVKEPVVEPVIQPVKEIKETIRKKKVGEKTLDYLNKFYDSLTYPNMYSEVCKGLKNVKPKLSLEDINVQFAEILKPIINNKKLILHSGMDGRTHKLYYVNDNQEWAESITYLEDLKIEIEEGQYHNIYDLVYEKFRDRLIEITKTNSGMEENMEYITHYHKQYDPKQIITLIIDGMSLPEMEEEQEQDQ